MTTGGHPPPISAEVLFNVRRRGLKRGDDYEESFAFQASL